MYVALCPCIGDPSLRAVGITHERDLSAFSSVLLRCKQFNIPVRFLPCSETQYLGEGRKPGHYLGRLDTDKFSSLLDSLENTIRSEFVKDGQPSLIIGVDSSPVCGVNTTWYGSTKPGEGKIPGRGVFLSRFFDIPAYDVFDVACWRAYLAAPLFSEAERDYNIKIAKSLSRYAISAYLPQETGDTSDTRSLVNQKEIFEANIQALEAADLVIAVIDGADADSGTAYEVGYAYAKGKRIISIRTDFRCVGANEAVNLMLEQSSVVVHDIEALIEAIPCPIQLDY